MEGEGRKEPQLQEEERERKRASYPTKLSRVKRETEREREREKTITLMIKGQNQVGPSAQESCIFDIRSRACSVIGLTSSCFCTTISEIGRWLIL